MSNKTFKLNVAKFSKATKNTIAEASRAIKISLFNGVIRDTRVDTGRLRGNWQTSTGSPITDVSLLRKDKTPKGSDGGIAQDDVLATVTAFGVDYITNNLVYAPVWNERDGIIDKNIARLRRNIREAVASVG